MEINITVLLLINAVVPLPELRVCCLLQQKLMGDAVPGLMS